MAIWPKAPASIPAGRDVKSDRGGQPRRRIVALVRATLLVYLGVALMFASLQTRLIFPGARSQGRSEAEVARDPAYDLITLQTARGDRIFALFAKALNPDGSPRSDAAPSTTLLFFYGNGMCLRAAEDWLPRFARLGCHVMIPEYVGYGMSGGKASESGCQETADAALAYLESRPDVARERIVVGGWSLGGAVAIDLAARRRVAGLATFCTFTSMRDMARRVVPWLPVSVLLRHRFASSAKLARVHCPILIGHGRLDDLVPCEMADRLAELPRGPVTRVTIDDAGHNDFFETAGDRIDIPFRQFIRQLPETNSARNGKQ